MYSHLILFKILAKLVLTNLALTKFALTKFALTKLAYKLPMLDHLTTFSYSEKNWDIFKLKFFKQLASQHFDIVLYKMTFKIAASYLDFCIT